MFHRAYMFSPSIDSCGVDLSPVCAVMGGLLAQEVLKAVSGKDLPLKNVVVFNGMLAEAGVQDLRP